VPAEARERSAFENEVLATASNLQDYLSLTSTFVFLQPHPEFTLDDPGLKQYLGFEPTVSQVSFLELISRSPQLSAAMAQIQTKAQEQWSASDQAIVRLTRSLYTWSQTEQSHPLQFIPQLAEGRLSWQDPWQSVLAAGSQAGRVPAIMQLGSIQRAFQADDQTSFDAAVTAFNTTARQELAAAGQRVEPGLELSYNRIDPFFKSKLLYGIGGLLTVLLLLFSARTTGPARLLYLGAIGLTVIGLGLHSYGLIARTLILSRPPVTNLYETFVFVSWTCVLLGLILELAQKQSIGLLIAAIAGFGFLHLAGRFNFDGDSMGMLAAVLNSSFWLTTHIMTIALGYAGCCCAGIIGHVYLINRIVRRQTAGQTARLAATLYGVLAFGLLFTLVGTLLGGMWADQSWGRFWGWDPKENGALLIILWCTILLHARAGRMMADIGLATGAIVGLMLVIFAWIGVNVLGVGLHSYGFTSQGASLLFGITLTETLFLTAIGLTHITFSRTRRAS
jgi:ABC-type transport system involved in cytochrome c biogenesis permease subunit